MHAPSCIPICVGELLDPKKETAAIRSPRQRPIQRFWLRPIAPEFGVFQVAMVVTILCGGWPNASIRRSLRMHHLLNGRSIAGQLKPINDRRQVRLWFRHEPLPVQPVSTRRRQLRNKIADAFMGLVPPHLRIERRRIGAEVVCCAGLREQINRVIESKHRFAGAPRMTRYVGNAFGNLVSTRSKNSSRFARAGLFSTAIFGSIRSINVWNTAVVSHRKRALIQSRAFATDASVCSSKNSGVTARSKP